MTDIHHQQQRRIKQLLAAIVFIAATTALITVVEARIPEGTIDRVRPNIYKNVRPTLMKSIIGEESNNIRGGGSDDQGRRKTLDQEHRALTPLETRCFTECIEKNYTPEECALYIQDQIEEAGGHEVGEVVVKIQTPRVPKVFSETYWMVEVPVNADGQMTCDRNNGQTFYPFDWASVSSGDVPVSNINCQGLSAGECCLAIRQYGQTELGGRDVNGYCLGCFAHIEPLIPVLNDATGLVEYVDYSYVGSTCTKMTMSAADVDATDAVTTSKMEAAIMALDQFSDAPSCVGFEELLEILYDAAIAIHPISELIGQLACTYCYEDGGDGDVTDVSPTDPLIVKLRKLLESTVPSSKENCIIIYTNDDGEIVDVPKLGGSRADEPYRVEEDCEDDEDEPEGDPHPSCPPGETYNFETETCDMCLAGTYKSSTEGDCIPCGAGTYSDADGASECKPCDSRTIAGEGSTQCTPCSEGYLEVDNTTCDACPAGTCQGGALNECVPCEPGLFQPSEGQNFCLQCPRQTFNPIERQTECQPCPEGSAADRGSTECTVCVAPQVVSRRGDRCVDP